MDLLLKVKGNEDLEKVISKGSEHLLETFNKDLMTVDELLAYTLDFITEIDNLKEEIAEMKRDKQNEAEARQFINGDRSEE